MKGEIKFGTLTLGEWVSNKSILFTGSGSNKIYYRFSLCSGDYGVSEHCVALFSLEEPFVDFRCKLKHFRNFQDQIKLEAFE